MGVTNAFAKANDLLFAELGYRLDPAADNLAFRQALFFAGWRRFEHCVTLCKMWARPTATGPQKHARLMDLMKLVTPGRNPATKYRNPAAGAAVQAGRLMDQAALEAAARDRCTLHKRRECEICDAVDSPKIAA